MAASCTHHLPTIISQLLNKSHTKKPLLMKSLEHLLEEKKKKKKKVKENTRNRDYMINK